MPGPQLKGIGVQDEKIRFARLRIAPLDRHEHATLQRIHTHSGRESIERKRGREATPVEVDDPQISTLPVDRRHVGSSANRVDGRTHRNGTAPSLVAMSVATVYDAGVTSHGRPYFVMELIDGVPITNYDNSRADLKLAMSYPMPSLALLANNVFLPVVRR